MNTAEIIHSQSCYVWAEALGKSLTNYKSGALPSGALFVPKISLAWIQKKEMQDIWAAALWVHLDASTRDKAHWIDMPVFMPCTLLWLIHTHSSQTVSSAMQREGATEWSWRSACLAGSSEVASSQRRAGGFKNQVLSITWSQGEARHCSYSKDCGGESRNTMAMSSEKLVCHHSHLTPAQPSPGGT